jgi:hypothetical protein
MSKGRDGRGWTLEVHMAGLSKSSNAKAASNPSGHNTRNAVIALAAASIPLVLNFLKKRNAQTHTAAAPASGATEGASVKNAF